LQTFRSKQLATSTKQADLLAEIGLFRQGASSGSVLRPQ